MFIMDFIKKNATIEITFIFFIAIVYIFFNV